MGGGQDQEPAGLQSPLHPAEMLIMAQEPYPHAKMKPWPGAWRSGRVPHPWHVYVDERGAVVMIHADGE